MNKVVIFVGVLTTYQGIDILLEAIPLVVREFPKVKFLIIGYPNEEAYRQKARSLGSRNGPILPVKSLMKRFRGIFHMPTWPSHRKYPRQKVI